MRTTVVATGLILIVMLGWQRTRAEQPNGIITCTSKVVPATCEMVTQDFLFAQAFPLLHSVQFVIADKQSFEQEKSGTADITLAKYVPHSTLIVHTSFENGVIFEITKDSGIHCPDRVVVSTELFRPVKTEIKGGKRVVPTTRTDGTLEHSEGVDPNVLMQYRMYILGFIEGCWAGR